MSLAAAEAYSPTRKHMRIKLSKKHFHDFSRSSFLSELCFIALFPLVPVGHQGLKAVVLRTPNPFIENFF